MTIEAVKFTLPVTIPKIDMLKDRSVKITAHSLQEIPDSEYFKIHKAFQAQGWLLFSQDRINEADVPKERTPDDGRKSDGQIQRGILWHIWNQNTDHSENDEAYIHRRRQKINDALKAELEP